MRRKRFLTVALLMMLLLTALTFHVSAEEPMLRYGYSTLPNEGTRYVYTLLTEAVPTLEEEIFIPEGTLTQEEMLVVRDAFASDYPAYFWFRGHMTVSSRAGVGWTVTLHYTLGDESVSADSPSLIAARQAVDARVEELISGIPADCDTDEERALYLHDLLAGEIEYVFNEHDQTVYGALVNGKAVCAGYARAYQLLLNEIGIRAWYVSGEGGNPISGESEAHAWNLVFLDDHCYYTDLTWNDQGENLYHAYYNLSLEEMSLDHQPEDPTLLPTCAHAPLDYFTAVGGIGSGVGRISGLTTGGEAAAFFPSLAIEGSVGETTASLHFEGEGFDAWLNREKGALASALGLSGSVSFQYGRVGTEYRLTVRGQATVIPLEEITLAEHALTLTSEAEILLEVELRPSATTERSLVWSSSNEQVLRVSAGRLIPVSNGVAVVRVSSSDGSVYDECTVTVALPLKNLNDVRADGISTPVAGGLPRAEVVLSEGLQKLSLVWETSPNGQEGSYLPMNGRFEEGLFYRVVLHLKVMDGYVLDEAATATVNGATATLEKTGETLSVTYEFGRLAAAAVFTVTYEVGDATLAPYTVTQYAPQRTLLIQPAQPWAENRVFVGWFLDPLGKDAWDFETDHLEGNLTLYAVFRARTGSDHVHVPQLQMQAGQPTTCTSAGRHPAYMCPDCNAVFLDAEGKFLVTNEQNLIPRVELRGEHTDADANGQCDICETELPTEGEEPNGGTPPPQTEAASPEDKGTSFLDRKLQIGSFEVPMLLLLSLAGLAVFLPILLILTAKKK